LCANGVSAVGAQGATLDETMTERAIDPSARRTAARENSEGTNYLESCGTNQIPNGVSIFDEEKQLGGTIVNVCGGALAD
jgi:hypothetical protein